jgi:outer membrane lipoprotein-sorting protein
LAYNPTRSLGGLLAIATVSILCSACALTAPSPPPPPESLEFQDRAAQIQQLTGKIAERDRALQSMQSEAVMQYSSPDRNPPKVREQITAKRPDSLRVEVMSTPFTLVLILATSGKHLTIFEPSKNKLVQAAATADTLNQFIRIPMAPADAVTLLLGIAPGSAALAERKPDTISTEDDMIVASWKVEDSERSELGFRGGQLAMVRMRTSTGAIAYEVRYSQYQDLGGLMFPYAIDATFPMAQSRLSFQYKRPIINGEVPASTFVLSPPSATEQANLDNANP